MTPLISVIIPIYGVEKYLHRAVDSVLGQTYRNLDIILVDDGSKDSCPEICDAYAAREARVRVVHKENGGLSDARNAGLAVAGGDYIAFLDSDDYWAPTFIEILYRELVANDADVALCSYTVTEDAGYGKKEYFERQRERYQAGVVEREILDHRKLLFSVYDAHQLDATYFIVAWNKLYKASLWKDIRFPKGKIHEDEATTYRIFDKAQKGVYVKMPLYAYFSMPDSITRESFKLRRLQWMDALDDRIAYFRQQEDYEIVCAAQRARADGAIKLYYPLLTYGRTLTVSFAKGSDELRKQKTLVKKESLRLRQAVKEALWLHEKGDKEKGYLPFTKAVGFRLFLLCPALYKKIAKVV